MDCEGQKYNFRYNISIRTQRKKQRDPVLHSIRIAEKCRDALKNICKVAGIEFYDVDIESPRDAIIYYMRVAYNIYKLIENESNQQDNESSILKEKYYKEESVENESNYIKIMDKSIEYIGKLGYIDIEIGTITYYYEKLTDNIFFDRSAGGRVFMESFFKFIESQ